MLSAWSLSSLRVLRNSVGAWVRVRMLRRSGLLVMLLLLLLLDNTRRARVLQVLWWRTLLGVVWMMLLNEGKPVSKRAHAS